MTDCNPQFHQIRTLVFAVFAETMWIVIDHRACRVLGSADLCPFCAYATVIQRFLINLRGTREQAPRLPARFFSLDHGFSLLPRSSLLLFTASDLAPISADPTPGVCGNIVMEGMSGRGKAREGNKKAPQVNEML